jgi:hypothetical protein
MGFLLSIRSVWKMIGIEPKDLFCIERQETLQIVRIKEVIPGNPPIAIYEIVEEYPY